ncbi:MAG: hypothetical protein Q4A92_11100 [Corynebacterium sp.]|nr:hypothetical protein [Corynebacterium sp.]
MKKRAVSKLVGLLDFVMRRNETLTALAPSRSTKAALAETEANQGESAWQHRAFDGFCLSGLGLGLLLVKRGAIFEGMPAR